MLIDAASLWYRAYYALPSSIKSPDGKRAGAIRGFLDAVATLVGDNSPTELVLCLEGNWRPQWRIDLIEAYKAQRVGADGAEDSPEGLDDQVAALHDIFAAWGIATATHPNFEADDVIATFAHKAKGPVRIVTGDRDLFQLVDDEAQRDIVYLVRGISKVEAFNAAAVYAKFDVWPHQYVDYAVMRGDASDGLAGVKGIGEKTAAALLEEWGSIGGVVAAADAGYLTERHNNTIVESVDYISKAITLSTCVTDVPVELTAAPLPTSATDEEALNALISAWGVEKAAARLKEAFATANPA